MSKPRSRLIGKADNEFSTVRGYTAALQKLPENRQKHIRGQPNHDESKSTITVSIQELQELVERKAGSGTWRQPNREVVDFKGRDRHLSEPGNGIQRPNTRGTIHYSKTGAHVVSGSSTQEEPAMTSTSTRRKVPVWSPFPSTTTKIPAPCT